MKSCSLVACPATENRSSFPTEHQPALWFVTVVVSCVLFLAGSLCAQNGYLDPIFGHDGRIALDLDPVGSAYQHMNAVAVQPDGKIVATGSFNGDMAVVRLNPDGSVDPTFSDDGWTLVTIDLIPDGADNAYGLIIQSDGKIVIVGSVDDVAIGSQYTDWVIARLNSDGSLDPSFGVNGVAIIELNPEPYTADAALDVVVQPDGKLVVVGHLGWQSLTTINYSAKVVRLNVDGSLDTTFSDDGIVSFGHTGTARTVELQDDGKIVVGGDTYDSYDVIGELHVARLNTNGTLDASFNGTGEVTIDFGLPGGDLAYGRAARIQPDGKIVVGGIQIRDWTNPEFAVARLLPDGSLDPGFSGDGKFIYVFDMGGEGNDRLSDVAIQPDGRIILGGSVKRVTHNRTDMGFACLNEDGTPDSSFGYGAYMVFPFNAGEDHNAGLSALAIQSDGKIIAVGYVGNDEGRTDLAFARLSAPATVFVDGFERGDADAWTLAYP